MAEGGHTNAPPIWGQKIKAALQAQRRTISWLARTIGMPQPQLSRTLAGKGGNLLRVRRARQIASALGCPYAALFPTSCRTCGAVRYEGESCECQQQELGPVEG